MKEMRLTVQEFFKTFPLPPKESSLIDDQVVLTLSTEQFFKNNNWTGKNLTNLKRIELEDNYLRWSVEQFFQQVSWKSSKILKSTHQKQKPEWKVSDLSSVF